MKKYLVVVWSDCRNNFNRISEEIFEGSEEELFEKVWKLGVEKSGGDEDEYREYLVGWLGSCEKEDLLFNRDDEFGFLDFQIGEEVGVSVYEGRDEINDEELLSNI